MTIQTPIQSEFKVWFTAQEMADAADCGLLRGVPTTKRGVNDLAERENWSRYHALVKSEKGRGGTITQYHLDLLPLDVRLTYLSRFVRVERSDLAAGAGEEVISERARTERDARVVAIRLADRFRSFSKLTAAASDHLFVLMFNGGKVEGLPKWVSETIGSLSVRSLARWRSKMRSDGGVGLAHDPSEARKGKGLLDTANDGEVRNFVLAWLAQNEALAAEEIMDYVEGEFGSELVSRQGELLPLPSLRTFQLFIKRMKVEKHVVLTKINNPDHYRSNLKLRGTGTYQWVKSVGQLLMIDASPGDALCVDGRHSIYVAIDIYSRDLVILVSKTPRAAAVCLMMRKAILHWKRIKAVKTDNGSDFVAAETVRFLDALTIEKLCSPKFTPEVKAHVERAIKTVQHKFFSQLPGYIGHNVAERKAIEDRKSFAQRLGDDDIETFSVQLTAAELQQKLDDWLEYKYRRRPHKGIKKRTPAEMVEACTAERRPVDERALDVLLMPAPDRDGIRKMTPQGVSVGDNYYLTGSILPGTEVFVRLHTDMDKVLLFSVEDGRYLATAICPKFANINRAEFVRQQKDTFNAAVARDEREIRKHRKKLLKSKSGIDRQIALYREKANAQAEARSNVVRLQQPEERVTTPHIEAALAAFDAADRHAKPAPMTEPLAALMAAVEADLAPQPSKGNVRPLRAEATPQQRFRAAQEIEHGLASGQQIEAERLLWLGSYRESAEYKTQKGIWEEFGDQAPVMRT